MSLCVFIGHGRLRLNYIYTAEWGMLLLICNPCQQSLKQLTMKYIKRNYRTSEQYSDEEYGVHNDNYQGNCGAGYYDSIDDDRRDNNDPRRGYIKNQRDTRGRDNRKYYDSYDEPEYCSNEWDDDNSWDSRSDYTEYDYIDEDYRQDSVRCDNRRRAHDHDAQWDDDADDNGVYDDWEYEGRGHDNYGYDSVSWDDDGCRDRRYQNRREYQNNRNRSRGKQTGRNRTSFWLLITVIIVAAAVLVFCAIKLVGISRSYSDSADYYNGITDQVAGGEQNVLGQASLNWNYNALLELCEDAVGYIYQKDTVISYPIMQAEDNDKYLRALMNGEYSIGGTLFVDYRCEGALDARYSIVYGHNMDDGSMFGSITSYKDESYYQKHKTFEIYSGEKMYTYYVYAAMQVPVDNEMGIFTIPSTDEEFLSSMQMLRAQNSYEMDDIEISADSKVVVLSTCIDYPRDYNYRYIVVLVRGEELSPAGE